MLVVGNICIDRFGDPGHARDALGGASAFATQVAVRAGCRPAMVTAAPPDCARLQPLATDARVRLHVRHCADVNLFEVVWPAGGERHERVVTQACQLTHDDIPPTWRSAPVAYVAPILDECGGAVVRALRSRFVAVGAQGWLRRLDSNGWIEHAECAEFKEPPANVSMMIFSDDDHPDGEREARRLARRGILTVLTRGADGGQIFEPAGVVSTYPSARAVERDATGAGDTFGCVFALAIARGMAPQAAASLAAQAAARVVEGPEMGSLMRIDWPVEPVSQAALGGRIMAAL